MGARACGAGRLDRLCDSQSLLAGGPRVFGSLRRDHVIKDLNGFVRTALCELFQRGGERACNVCLVCCNVAVSAVVGPKG